MRMNSSLCAALPCRAALMRFATAMKPGKHFLGVYSFSAIRSIAAAPPSVKPGEALRNRPRLAFLQIIVCAILQTPERTTERRLHMDKPCVPSLEKLQETYRNDRFATQAAHCRIVEATADHVVCEMPIEDVHLNAHNAVMGGATFTLADFVLAVMSNIVNPPSVTLTSEIRYLGTAKGTKLVATGHIDKSGRRTGFFTVDVTDDLGTKIAKVSSTTFHVG